MVCPGCGLNVPFTLANCSFCGSPMWAKRPPWLALFLGAAIAAGGMTAYNRLMRIRAPRSTPPAAAVVSAPITVGCATDEKYRPLPGGETVVVIVQPTGSGCWTPWLHRPAEARIIRLAPESDVDAEVAQGEGTIESRHVSPLSDWSPRGRPVNAMRFKNPTHDPVRIVFGLDY